MLAWHIWAITAMVLMLLELFGAHFVLLGLGLAAAVVAIVVAFAPATEFGAQLLIFVLAAIIIVPLIIVIYRRYFPEGGVSVMNEPGGEAGEPRRVLVRDGRTGVDIYGDFYPVRYANSGLEPKPGTEVVITEFQGITALVKAVSNHESQGD